ncbi:hypothetical protein GCM10028802_31910 [Terrabacter terrigena]
MPEISHLCNTSQSRAPIVAPTPRTATGTGSPRGRHDDRGKPAHVDGAAGSDSVKATAGGAIAASLPADRIVNHAEDGAAPRGATGEAPETTPPPEAYPRPGRPDPSPRTGA